MPHVHRMIEAFNIEMLECEAAAPKTALLIMKRGTPEMPSFRAHCSSNAISAQPSSLARKRSVSVVQTSGGDGANQIISVGKIHSFAEVTSEQCFDDGVLHAELPRTRRADESRKCWEYSSASRSGIRYRLSFPLRRLARPVLANAPKCRICRCINLAIHALASHTGSS
jgi:hypothetical protein